MFRDGKCRIKRPTKSNINGEIIYNAETIIYENVPCHLSVKSLSAINQTQSTATVLLDYVLFIDTIQNVTILKNDIVEVTTAQGDSYRLRAGESHKYPMTIQTHCEIIKVA